MSIVVSLSLWIASQAESSTEQRHWLQEEATPAPTPSNTEDATGDAGGVDDGGGDFGETEQPTNDPLPETTGGDETPAPTMAEGEFGGTPAPTMFQGFGTPSPTESQVGFGTPAPTESQAGFGTPAPTESQGGFGTPAPTMIQWSETPAPTVPFPAPVDSFPWEEEETPRPESVYVATDDDPLQPVSTGMEEDAAWKWNDSTADDVEHDRTVLIALTVTFAVGVCLAILTAQQMLENPNGCCVSICRILVALTCGITRCVCYPCRAMCGCTNPDRRNHEIMLQSDDNYTHDLELS